MLDQDTKRRIDNACDILVGKVPTPLAQVEQITLALIYKFMNDMDKRALAMGGMASYFTGDYEKYSWDNLMDSRIGAQERANLYEEGLNKLSTNGELPDLFRGIFKEASIPYRAARTLNLFLQEIDGFSYEDSENLGDAYEYLLGKTGSQGEAGQFRTPRHIIDFIVQVVDPNKHDSICDPACGTAGFLISALKHIYKANTKEIEGDQLSPGEQLNLSNSVYGYDITPDMVRISRVNMFLHNIRQPHIYEYDTLSSLDRWDDDFSCILANPPFMTPKGGVTPHNRFSITSTRSEVLFVDYIMEHLTLDGKAGVIVPEGIIFQSGSAHKALRKKLITENYLWGVVSLPGGVFYPYSGVKTSILLIDRQIAKRSDRIIFFKVENDGYNLGAQRRPIEANDLPEAANQALKFKQAVMMQREYEVPDKGVILVEKKKLEESGDYNLSGERYNHNVIHSSTWNYVELRQLVDIVSGGTPDTNNPSYWDGTINWATLVDLPAEDFISEISGTCRKITDTGLQSSSARLLPVNTVILSSRATIGRVGINKIPIATNQGFKNLIVKDSTILNYRYLAYIMRSLRGKLESLGTGGTYKEVSKSSIESVKIPLPPLSVQEEIVAELDSYQKIIDGAKQVVDNWKPRIDIDPEWDLMEIGSFVQDSTLGMVRNKSEQNNNFTYPYLKMNNISYKGDLDMDNVTRVNATLSEVKKYSLVDGDFLYNTRNSPELVGKSCVFHGETSIYLFNNNMMRIRFTDELLPDYLNYIMNSDYGKSVIQSLVAGTTSVAAIYQKEYFKINVPVPERTIQMAIVENTKKERKLVDANRKLIELFEQKIIERIDKLWKLS